MVAWTTTALTEWMVDAERNDRSCVFAGVFNFDTSVGYELNDFDDHWLYGRSANWSREPTCGFSQIINFCREREVKCTVFHRYPLGLAAHAIVPMPEREYTYKVPTKYGVYCRGYTADAQHAGLYIDDNCCASHFLCQYGRCWATVASWTPCRQRVSRGDDHQTAPPSRARARRRSARPSRLCNLPSQVCVRCGWLTGGITLAAAASRATALRTVVDDDTARCTFRITRGASGVNGL